MQVFLIYVVPAIEAVIIVILLYLLHTERAEAMRDYEQRCAEAEARRAARMQLPTKQQMEDYRKRHPDFRQNTGTPTPPPSMTARFKNKD